MPFPSHNHQQQRHDVVVTHSASTSSSGSINTVTSSQNSSSIKLSSYKKESRSRHRRSRRQRNQSPNNSNQDYHDTTNHDDHVVNSNDNNDQHHQLLDKRQQQSSNRKSPKTGDGAGDGKTVKIHVTRKYSLFRKIACYIMILLIGFVFVISSNWNNIQLNSIHSTHTTKYKTTKSANGKGATLSTQDFDDDNVIVFPLQPRVQSILGVDHYYMLPHDIFPGDSPNIEYDNGDEGEKDENEYENDTTKEQHKEADPPRRQSSPKKTSWLSNLFHPKKKSSAHKDDLDISDDDDIDDDDIQLDTKTLSSIQQPGEPKKKKHKHPKPKGILIFLHSCKRSGLDFFYLPEERRIAYDALSRGMALLSLTSQHRDSGCWTQPDVGWIDNVVDTFVEMQFGSSDSDTEDIDGQHQVVAIADEDSSSSSSSNSTINNSSSKTKVSVGGSNDGIPRIGIAVSSAASFLFFVYESLHLQSMAIINSPQSYGVQEIESRLAIPTVYVSMPHDKHIAKQMQANHEALIKANLPSQLYKVRPTPFTYELCTKRIPEIGTNLCRKLITTIQNDYPSLLDSDGFIRTNSINNINGGGGDAAIKPSSFVDESNIWYQLLQSIGLDDYDIVNGDNDDGKGGNRHRTLRKRTKTKRKKTTSSVAKDDANYDGDDEDSKNNSIVYQQHHLQDDYYLSKTSHSGHSWLWAAVEEEISTCYAYHSMTAEHHRSVLEFLIQQAGIE